MSNSERPRFPRTREADSFWAQYSPTARHGTCIAILLVVALSFYSPMIFGGKAIHSSDKVGWRAKVNALLEHREETGENALWNPNVYSGMPAFVMNYKTKIPQLDEIADKARSVVWPVSHLFFLLLGMYALVFYLTRNSWSGLLSTLAFAFTTYIPIILSAGHNTKFIALSFAPFVVLAFVYALRNPSLLNGLLFAAALACELRAKHPQITYGVLMLLLVWWIVELVWAWREDELVPFAQSTGWLALGTGGALCMVAQPYLGIYEYKQFSVRGGEAIAASAGSGGSGGGMGWEKAMSWSQGPKELLTLVIADAFGGGGRMYWGPKVFTVGPHYVGGIVAALSGLALWRVRSRVTWGLGAGVLVTVLFSLGKYAPWINGPMFEYFPFFSAFRAPETWLSATALGLAILAGIGLDYSMRGTDAPKAASEGDWSMLYAFGGLAGIVLLLLIGKNAFFDFESKREQQIIQQVKQRPNLSRSSPRVRQFYQQLERRKKQRREAFQADALRTLIVVGLALLFLWLYRRRRVPAWVAGGIVVLLVTIDLWGVDRRYLGEEQFSSNPDRTAEIPTYDYDRFLNQQVEKEGGPGRFRVFPWQTPRGSKPMNNPIPSYHHQSIGGAHPAKLLRYQHYIDHILRLSQDGTPNENALDLMNARYIVAQQKLPGTSVVYESNQTKSVVLENPDAVPRGFFVGQTEVVNDAQTMWQRLRSSSFNPRTTGLLSESLDAEVAPIEDESATDATIKSYGLEEITWQVRTNAPRLFVASEVHYPEGWEAYIDGRPVHIHRVDYLLRGVHVPEGEHTLTMRFQSVTDRYSTLLAGGTTVLVYGGILFLLAVRHREWCQDRLKSVWGEDNGTA